MNLLSIRIIAADIDRMIKLYEKVIGISITQYTPDFAELKTKTATLAIGSTRTLQFFGGESVAQLGVQVIEDLGGIRWSVLRILV